MLLEHKYHNHISFSTLFPSSVTGVLLSRSCPFHHLFYSLPSSVTVVLLSHSLLSSPPVSLLFSPVLMPFDSLLSYPSNVSLLFSSPVLMPFHSLLSPPPVSLLFSSPIRSNPISLLSPSSVTVVPLSRSIPFHYLLSSPQCHCCSPLPFYPISVSTLSPSVPLLFSSPVLSHCYPPLLFSSPVLSHFIQSFPSSSTVVLLSIPFHSLLSSLQCHCCSPLPFYPIPPLFSSPVLHSLLSSLQCQYCYPLPLYPISFSTLSPPVPLLFSSPVLSHFALYSLPLQCHCCSPLPLYPISLSTLFPPLSLLLFSSRSNPISLSTLFPPVPLVFSSPVIIPYHSLLSSTQCHCCSPLPFYPISFSLPSSAYIVLLPRSNPISFSTLSPPVSPLFPSPVLSHFIIYYLPLQCHYCSPLPFYPISLFPSNLSPPVSSLQCCSPLPFYPISFSTLFPPVPLLFSSPVLSHFILYSLRSSATVVLLSRSNPISFSTLFPPVPVVLLSRSIPFHSLLSSSSATVLLSRSIPFHSLSLPPVP